MKVIGKDRTSCDVCNPIDEIIARLDALERRASAIVAKVQGIAPDGEGNVTLPTSSSDTDPLHGRVDAFAMSSEVKEAADDAHAYAASIADDVIVINSEIDALNQAVAALQPAEIEAIKSAVQTLQTTVATLESTVATLNDAVVKKVSKSGDTMTGALDIRMSRPQLYLTNTTDDFSTPNTAVATTYHIGNLDKNGQDTFHMSEYTYNGGRNMAISLRSKTTGNVKEANLGLTVEDSGVVYATAPSWSVGTNDNSDKVLTIKMANSLPSLVHTTGNETIAGAKNFSGTIYLDNSLRIKPIASATRRAVVFNKVVDGTEMGWIGYPSDTGDMVINLISGNSVSINKSTPSGATGQEIATADWVITKINEMATKNKLAGL